MYTKFGDYISARI